MSEPILSEGLLIRYFTREERTRLREIFDTALLMHPQEACFEAGYYWRVRLRDDELALVRRYLGKKHGIAVDANGR